MMNQSSRRAYAIDKKALLLLSLLLLILSPFFAPSAWAQTADSPWEDYTDEDGLASNNVWQILPLNGEIWFGTENGVSRFNGEWTSWKRDGGFVEGAVKALASDETQGSIWMGTDQGILARWNGQTWQVIHEFPSAIHAIEVEDSQIWVGTAQGLFIWNGAEAVEVEALQGLLVQSMASHAHAVWVGTEQGLWLYQRQAWTEITVEDGLPGNNVTALWIDPNGPVWIGTTEGIARRDPAAGTWEEIETEHLSIEGRPFHVIALTGDENGDVWGGTEGGGAFQIFKIPSGFSLLSLSGEIDIGLTTRYVQTVAIDHDGSIWFGTRSGVFRNDRKTWGKELRDSVLFPGINYINSLLVDEKNQVWIGTLGAGIRVKEQGSRPSMPELIYTTQESALPDDNITAFASDEQGNIWAGTGRGLAHYQQASRQWTQPIPDSALPSPAVNTLLFEQGDLWIGTDAGLVQYELESRTHITIEALAQKNVQALAVDSLRHLWVGTLEDGVFVQTGDETWQQYRYEPGNANTISGNAVVALSADPSGGMWVGINRHGLNYWDGDSWVDYTDRIRLPSNLLYTLYTDPVDGSLWIGSEGGVTRYDGRTWETLSVEGILPNASIFAIAGTLDGSYWFGGKDGLTFYRPEKTPPWIRVDTISGSYTELIGNTIEVQAGEQIGVRFVAGDLHTAPADLEILYRISGPGQIGDWLMADGQFLQLPEFGQTGTYLVELLARDQSFNYSETARLGLEIIPPPPTIALPVLGRVRQDTFVALLVTGLIALIGFGYMSLEIMHNRRRTREALSRGFNPFVSGEPVRRQDMFFGRHDLLQRIVDTLHNNSIMIHGERRIGKTTLLYQLAAQLREVADPEYWFIPLYIDLEGTTEEAFFHFLMEEILHGAMTLPEARQRLQPALQDLIYQTTPTPGYTDREFSRDLRDVIQALQIYGEEMHPSKNLRLILLLDEMDVMSSYSRLVQQRLRRIFMRDFAATLGAVVAGIQISKEWDRVESPWYNLFNEIELRPFSREQAVELLTEPVQEYYRYEPAALEFIVEKSEGRPFRLQQYALEAVNHMLARGRRVITLDDVEYAHEHIQHMGNDTDVGLDTNGRSTNETPLILGETPATTVETAGEKSP